MFGRVLKALTAANLTDKYKTKFLSEDMTDELVLECIENPSEMDTYLSSVIPSVGHRLKFLKEFKKLQKQSQVEDATLPMSNEIPSKNSSSSSASSSFCTRNVNSTSVLNFAAMIKEVFENGIEIYNDNMSELLRAPGVFVDESILTAKHEENKTSAMEHFSTQYEQFKSNMSQVRIKTENEQVAVINVNINQENEVNFNAKLSELADTLDSKFEEYKEKNELRLSNYKSTARNILLEAEKLYTDKMKMLIDSCTDEEELRKREQEMTKELINHLNNNIQNPHANPEFITGLNEEFIQSKNKCFQDYLEFFQLSREEDEIVVNKAFDIAKSYYKEELEKILQSESFIEPAEFGKQDEKIFEKALKTCKELKLTPNQEKELKGALKGIFKIYEDKNLLRKPTSFYAIGIDLGTTNSCVAVYKNGKVEVIINDQGNRTTPSFVCFQGDGSVLVGDTAKDQSYRNPQNTIFDAKRLIGRDFKHEKVQENLKSWPFKIVEENEKPKIRIEMNSDNLTPVAKRRKTKAQRSAPSSPKLKDYHCEEVSALVLRKLKMSAEKYLGCEVKNACVTVPALFNDYQRQATRDAGEIAGLNVLRIINEPTAAAISYNLHRTDEIKRNVLVFDLGGGTFDVSVLQIVSGEINVKAVHGDVHLGGGDFDTEMVKYCIEQFKEEHGIDLARGRNSHLAKERFDVSCRLRRIRNECERQKKALSSTTNIVVGLEMIDSAHPDLNLHVPVTRAQFELLNQKHFDRCIEIVQLALEEAKMSKSDIDDVVLVGGSTRIPKIQKMLSDFFDGKILNNRINPDESVAEGAAIQACILNGQRVDGVNELKLTDVTSFSIGIQDSNGEHAIQIPKNSPLPCTHTETWVTSEDNQTEVWNEIYEGEDPIAKNNNLLGSFLLVGIPPNKAQVEEVRTTTSINEEGILHVKDTCVSNGISNELTVKTFNNRMTRKEIEDAKEHIQSIP